MSDENYVLVQFKIGNDFDYVPISWIWQFNKRKIDKKHTYKSWWNADKRKEPPSLAESEVPVTKSDDTARVDNNYYRIYFIKFCCKYTHIVIYLEVF